MCYNTDKQIDKNIKNLLTNNTICVIIKITQINLWRYKQWQQSIFMMIMTR